MALYFFYTVTPKYFEEIQNSKGFKNGIIGSEAMTM